jgi:hypothetical protein
MTLSGVYGFWKYVTNLDRRETRRYLEMLYALKYRKMVCATLSHFPSSISSQPIAFVLILVLLLCVLVQATTVPLAIEGEASTK